MAVPQRPDGRDGFQVGVICALSLEAEMVEQVFDKRYRREEGYGKAQNDTNTYTTGAIAGHNTVLAYCPGLGAIAAAQAASNLKRSFPGIQIVFVVGICGAVPFHKEEIVLGDCIISTDMIQSDFGRIGPGGLSRREPPAKAAVVVRSLLSKLQATDMREDIKGYLRTLQKEKDATYPGAGQDRLYEASYIHTHEACSECDASLGLCKRECADIGCDDAHLIQRQRRDDPRVHFGAFSSSNQVIKCGEHRDTIAGKDIVAFEMEAAGVWEVFPTIIIKAACDYADSHKNKKWQAYAAAVAAASLKAVLGILEPSDLPESAKETTPALSVSSDPVSKADAAIRKYYKSGNRLHVERLSGAKLPLDKCYINLALVDRATQASQQKESFYLKARLRIAAETIGKGLSVEKLFESQRLSNGTTGIPRRIFIQGRAGVGKTTLCKKLVYEFLQGLGSNLFDRLLWIPLRRLKEKEEYSWLDLLQDAYTIREPSWRQNIVQYSEQFYETNFLDRTLLLFDGLDEISHGWRENQFYDFLVSIICDSPNIIITSRPQAKTFDPGSFDMELETTGFLPDQIDIYLQNCVTRSDTIRDMKSFMDARPFVQSLLRIPIQLDAFCCTWPAPREISDGSIISEFHGLGVTQLEGISTMTTLYHAISLELSRKDLGQLQPGARPREMSDFEITQALTNELTFLGELAWQGMWNNIIEYQPRYYDRIGMHASKSVQLSTPYSSILDRLSFLRTSDIEQHPSKRNYHFLHLTFQEFFAARHFVAHWVQYITLTCLDIGTPEASFSPVQFLRSEKYNPRYNIFWRFVTGLIQLQAGITHARNPQHDVCAFFALLEGEPLDMVGFTHRRLLMVCLSETLDSQDPEILKLRRRLESYLRSAITEGSPDYSIDREPEFPENVLRSERKQEPGKLRRTGTGAYLDPTHALAGSGPALERRIFAASLACQHWVGDPQKLLSLVTPLLLEVGKNEMLLQRFKTSRLDYIKSFEAFTALSAAFLDKGERKEVRRSLGAMLQTLSPQSTSQLVAILTDVDEDTYIRQCAGRFLWDLRGSLDEDTITGLFKTLSKEYPSQELFAEPPRYQSVSNEDMATIANILRFKDEEEVEIDAFRTLWASCLLFRPTATCISLIKERRTPLRVRREAVYYLSGLVTDDVDFLVTLATDEEEDRSIRGHAFRLLLERPIIPDKGLAALVSLIETGDSALLDEAASGKVTGGRVSPQMSDKVASAMIQALKDEKADVVSILDSSWWQGFTLSRDSVKAIVEVMRQRSSAARMSTAVVLARQLHCSTEDALWLASMADDADNPDSWKGHYHLMATLHDRDIYYTIVDPNIRLWKSLYFYWQSSGYLYGICCYQLNGLLYIWFGGTRHQITTTAEHSRKLLDAIGKGGDRLLGSGAISSLSLGNDNDSGYVTEAGDKPGSANRTGGEHSTERNADLDAATGTDSAGQVQTSSAPRTRWRDRFPFITRGEGSK